MAGHGNASLNKVGFLRTARIGTEVLSVGHYLSGSFAIRGLLLLRISHSKMWRVVSYNAHRRNWGHSKQDSEQKSRKIINLAGRL